MEPFRSGLPSFNAIPAAVILSMMAAVSMPPLMHGQSCVPMSNAMQNPTTSTPPGSDGLIHVTYATVDSSGNAMTPNPEVASAISGAVGEWNAFSSTTGVQFDPLPTGQDPSTANIQIQQTTDSSGNTGGCAAYRSAAGRVYYGETFLQAAHNGYGSTIFAHELGHSLDLDEGGTNPNPPSIMNNPSNPPPAACTNPSVPTTSVQPNDASAVSTCTKQAKANYQQILNRAKTRSSLGPPYETLSSTLGTQTCTYFYSTITFYVDGEFDSSEQVLTDYSCD